MKRLIVVASALLLLLAGFAFANGQKESASSTSKKITLNIAWWGNQAIDQHTLEVLKMYEKAHPNITFSPQYPGWTDYWTQMDTLAASNSLPDIMGQDYSYITEWQSRGRLMNLTPFVDNKTINLAGIAKPAVSGGIINGKYYGIDLGTNALAFVLNTDLFKKAGIPIPPDNWTWSDFQRIAMELHAKLGIWGMGYGLDDVNQWRNLYLGTGHWVFSSNGKSLGYPRSMDNVFVHYLEMVKSLESAGAIPPISSMVAHASQGVETRAIVNGKSAMGFMWSNQVVEMWGAAGLKNNYTLLPVPRLSSDPQSPNYVKNSAFMSISTDSTHPKQAAEFINYFTNSVAANKVMDADWGVPISPKVRNALKESLTKPTRAEFDYLSSVTRMASPTPPPDPPGASTLQFSLYGPEVFQPFMFGKMTAQQAAVEMRTLAAQHLGH